MIGYSNDSPLGVANEALRVAAHECIDLSKQGQGYALAIRSPTETTRGRLTLISAVEIPDDGKTDENALARDWAESLGAVLAKHGLTGES